MPGICGSTAPSLKASLIAFELIMIIYIYIYSGSGRFPGPMELLLQQLVRVSKTG